jgi:hypothetical protein
MNIKTKNIIRYGFTLSVILLILFFSSLLWLSNGQITPIKEKVFRHIPFPVAFIEGRALKMNDFLFRYNRAGTLSNLTDLGTYKSNLLNRMIEEKKLQIISEKFNVAATKIEIENEFARRKKENSAINEYLKTYGLDEELYKNNVLKSELNATKLATWYYSQTKFNEGLYKKANGIYEKAASGEDFSLLARTFSDDQTAANFLGDEGFVTVDQLLPELSFTITQMKENEIKIVPTRFGLEIIRLNEVKKSASQASDSYHIQHIFLISQGFSNWLADETKNIKIIKFVNF